MVMIGTTASVRTGAGPARGPLRLLGLATAEALGGDLDGGEQPGEVPRRGGGAKCHRILIADDTPSSAPASGIAPSRSRARGRRRGERWHGGSPPRRGLRPDMVLLDITSPRDGIKTASG